MPINACGPMKRNPGVGSVVYAEQTSRVLIEGRVARGEGGGMYRPTCERTRRHVNYCYWIKQWLMLDENQCIGVRVLKG